MIVWSAKRGVLVNLFAKMVPSIQARNAALALRLARTMRPDRITVDLLMPGLDGAMSFLPSRSRLPPSPQK